MAKNWNAILSNTNNLTDVLAILKKVLAMMGDLSTLNASEIIENIDNIINSSVNDFSEKQNEALVGLKDAINTALAAGAGEAGWNANLIAYGNRNQQQVNDDLLGDNGAAVINLDFTETALSTSIKKSLYDVIYDQMIDVTWFGAIGNWNKNTQTGFNSTQAVKNAISYLVTLGTRRTGGRRGLKFPKGSYRIDDMQLPESLGFGLDIIGDGVKTTNLYFDHNSTNSAIDCQIEFVQFRNMSLIGSLDETWKTSRTSGFKGYLLDKRADIDVTFFNCEIVYWNEFAEINGRGCIFESCAIGLVICAMSIIVKDYSHGADTDLMQSKFASMRHYSLRNCRFDNCSRAYRVTGSGEMIDHINSLTFIANDITNMDLLIEAPDAQFSNSIIANNVGIGSFATSVIKAKAMHSSLVSSNNFTKSTNYKSAPTSNADATEFFFNFTAPCSNLVATNNIVRGIHGAFYKNTSTSPSKNINLLGNNLPEFGSWKGGNSTLSFYLSSANCKNLLIKDNNFSCSNISGNYYLCNFNNTQQAIDVVKKDNTAAFAWSDRVFSSTPVVYVNNIATTGVTSIKVHQYIADGDYIEGYLYLSGTIPETSGAVTIDLPTIAVALASAFASIVGGDGEIFSMSGVSSTGFVLAPLLINSSTQRIELRKQKDMVITAIDAADIPSTLSVAMKYKYRFK